MSACTTQNNVDFSELVADIQQNNISDKRLVYWDIKVQTESDNPKVSGATVAKVAFKELETLAEKHNLKFDVELLPQEKFKENPWGIVTLSVCNIRAIGRHSAELVTQAIMGTPVKVFSEVDDWYLVQTPDSYFGWVDAAAIALKTNTELVNWKALKKVLYKNQNGFAYCTADEKGLVETDLVLANLLSVVGAEKDFYNIIMADGREGFVKKDECVSLKNWNPSEFSLDNVLATAANFKGVPYLWGGTSAKMVDCSGFTKSSYYMHGIILQRDASQQTLYGGLVETVNNYKQLQAGDLVFFGKKATDAQQEKVTHVGLCVGNQEFIHASGKVRINSLDRNSDKYTEYYETAFVRARRIAGNVEGVGIEWIVENEFYKEILPE